MPENPNPKRYPGKVFTLRHAAEAGYLIEVYCGHCRRLMRYLATDLITLLNPEREAREPPFACSKCNNIEWVTVKLRSPVVGDYGNLPVRRPSEIVHTQLWRTVMLGDEV